MNSIKPLALGTASYVLRPRSPLSWLDPGVFGTLGVGGGFMLGKQHISAFLVFSQLDLIDHSPSKSPGAKVVRPSAEVWVIFGDGSCGMLSLCVHGSAMLI